MKQSKEKKKNKLSLNPKAKAAAQKLSEKKEPISVTLLPLNRFSESEPKLTQQQNGSGFNTTMFDKWKNKVWEKLDENRREVLSQKYRLMDADSEVEDTISIVGHCLVLEKGKTVDAMSLAAVDRMYSKVDPSTPENSDVFVVFVADPSATLVASLTTKDACKLVLDFAKSKGMM